MAQNRAATGVFGPAAVDQLLDDIGLPRPARTSNVFATLKGKGLFTDIRGPRGSWKLTPEGQAQSQELASDLDLAALEVEMQLGAALLGDTPHPVIPPHLAPPELIKPLRAFLEKHPFDLNVFGMTRFPGKPEEGELDPIAPALDVTREVCAEHGYEFHLASDRQIVDDLWANVAAHMWGCHYGIAFFEERTPRGLNYNLTIEVGSCLVLGRRLALLKDEPLKALPTDLTGKIYREVNLEDPDTVRAEVAGWLKALHEA